MVRQKNSILACAVFLAGTLAALPAAAGDITLLWDPSSGATGYKAHWGTSSGNPYGNMQDVGNSTQADLGGLTDCQMHYFAVTAYNSAGESGFSNEISSWPRPVVSQSNPSTGERGERMNLVVTGTNYQAGASVSFGNPEITVNSVNRDACGQMTVDITIDSSAPLGPTEVAVTNPNGLRGAGGGMFTVAPAQQQVPDPPSNLRFVTP